MNQYKNKVWELFGAEETNNTEIREYVKEYEERYPYDMDIYIMKIELALLEDDLHEADGLARKAIKKYPNVSFFHERFAYICELKQNYFEAYEHYSIALFLTEYCQDDKKNSMTVNLERVVQKLELEADKAADKGAYLECINELMAREKNIFGYNEKRFRNSEQIEDAYYYENTNTRRYIALYRNSQEVQNSQGINLVKNKVELQKVQVANAIRIEGEEGEYIVPVIVPKEDEVVVFCEEEKAPVHIVQRHKRSFYYYRVPTGTIICAKDKCFFGSPIPVGYKTKRKKLVLNIFLDGASQTFLKGENLSKYMPNTYHYFKKGIICNQAYSSGEWTYPSIASYVSGLYTTEHMMFHNVIDSKLPEDVKTLAEYFQENGYYTSCFSGDWRIIPPYGHARGYDRFFYQQQHVGFSVEKMVGEVLEQIEAMWETNQFVWMSIGDLHDIADEMELPTCIQTVLNINDRKFEENNETSVKQKYSISKTTQYEKMLGYVDYYLGMLFQYLEQTYKDDEILVSLFSDHGQGYLVPDDGEFLGPERTNVTFMFRENQYNEVYSDEIMSAVDYTAVMCKLAGIQYDFNNVSGKLPQAFGGEGRKWAIVDSLHPKDPYRVALYGKDYRFYFTNGAPVNDEGRFELTNYEVRLVDTAGMPASNPEIEKECLELVLDHIAHLIIY